MAKHASYCTAFKFVNLYAHFMQDVRRQTRQARFQLQTLVSYNNKSIQVTGSPSQDWDYPTCPRYMYRLQNSFRASRAKCATSFQLYNSIYMIGCAKACGIHFKFNIYYDYLRAKFAAFIQVLNIFILRGCVTKNALFTSVLIM